jgi:hypothetical protein
MDDFRLQGDDHILECRQRYRIAILECRTEATLSILAVSAALYATLDSCELSS